MSYRNAFISLVFLFTLVGFAVMNGSAGEVFAFYQWFAVRDLQFVPLGISAAFALPFIGTLGALNTN